MGGAERSGDDLSFFTDWEWRLLFLAVPLVVGTIVGLITFRWMIPSSPYTAIAVGVVFSLLTAGGLLGFRK